MTAAPMIVSITYKPEDEAVPDERAFTRVPVNEAALVVGHGIAGDRKGGHPTRQINIMGSGMLAQLQTEGFTVTPGSMGEQLVISGIEVDSLTEGEKLMLGEVACVEVMASRQGCTRFTGIQGVNELPKGRMGVMARVVTAGPIHVGDPVRLLQE